MSKTTIFIAFLLSCTSLYLNTVSTIQLYAVIAAHPSTQEPDKQLLVQQFGRLPIISTYVRVRDMLRELHAGGIPALVRVERELLAKVTKLIHYWTLVDIIQPQARHHVCRL